MVYLTCSATAALSLPPPPTLGVFVRAVRCAHTGIHPRPWSPCGFKVLILIRFELTYCQSGFSCSSETVGSSRQDLDLGSSPCTALSPLAARGIQMKGHLPASPSWSVSESAALSEDELNRGPCGPGVPAALGSDTGRCSAFLPVSVWSGQNWSLQPGEGAALRAWSH